MPHVERQSNFYGVPVVYPTGDEEQEHDEFYGPSDAQRWISCPGSVSLARVYGKGDPGDMTAADWGSFKHTLLWLEEDEMPGPDVIDGYDRWQVDFAREHIRSLVQSNPTEKILFERRVEVRYDGLLWITYGTLDVEIYCPDFIIVVDMKFGKWPVAPAQDNWQLKLYCSAVWFEEICGRPGQGRTQVLGQICQPQNDADTRVSEHWFDLCNSTEYLKKAWQSRCLSEKGTTAMVLNPSIDNCRYCLVKDHCNAYNASKKNSVELAKRVTTDASMTNEELIELYPMLKDAKDRINAMIAEIDAKIKKGELEVPGFGICNGSSRSTLRDAEGTYNAIQDLMPVSEFMRDHVSVSSIDKLATAYGRKFKAAGLGTIKAGKEQFMVLADKFIKKGSPYTYVGRKAKK